jgi:cobalt/nickel transport system ATP-binding protein
MDNLFSIKNLNFSYDGKNPVLKNINLDIPKNKRIVFIGPNGSGKTTLFLHLNGVLKPDSGKIFYNGMELKYEKDFLRYLRSEIAIVFQNPEEQLFCSTVEEDLAFGPKNLLLSDDEIAQRVDFALELLDIKNLKDKPISQLSFGQKKRVAIAGALAMMPKVLIMDEPTAGLDNATVHELLELSDELIKKGTSILISTHDIETVWEWAEEVIVLNNGNVFFQGQLGDFFYKKDELVHNSNLYPPFSFQLNYIFHKRTKKPLTLYPKSYVELIEKIIPSKNKKTGKLLIVFVDTLNFDKLEDLYKMFKHHQTGLFGSKARKFSSLNKISVHYKFHSLENAFFICTQGENFLLFSESNLKDLIIQKFNQFQKSSKSKINIEFFE